MSDAIKNQVRLIGKVYGNIESVPLESGRVRTKFIIQTRDIIGAQGLKEDVVNDHQIFCYGKLSEIAEKYCKNGIEVGIEGILSNWVDQSIVIATDLLILTKK